ncbi:hypothetical protein [Umezawaea beigongshangensis]|uniref:hypothetical protein n=1 Tax=Umezawaea beigongshangensis TaxID=2780383 RepID=UPI003F68536A
MPGPDTRVVELRVHGVQGTTPESLVDAVAAVDVAGDGTGRVVRPADRLRRPAPGPVLQVEGRPVPRTVEGYLWGGMTSGGLAKATWALLFPFCVANVAHWMLPPVREGSTAGRLLGVALRSLLRLAALLLTVLLVVQVAVVSLDLLAVQCLAPGSACLDEVPDRVRDLPWFRSATGLLPVALAVFVLWRVSMVTWRVESAHTAEQVERAEGSGSARADQPAGGLSGLPGAHVATDPDTPALRALHAVAGLAAVSLFALGGPLGPAEPGVAATGAWFAALALGIACALGVLLLDDPTGARSTGGGRVLRAVLARAPRRVLLAIGAALLLVTTGVLRRVPDTLPGVDAGVQLIAALLGLVVVALAVLLIPAALLARRTWTSVPRELRPWAGGWMAAPVLVVAVLLGGGFGAGIGLTAQKSLGHDLVLPRGYDRVTLLWGAAGVLGLLAVVAVASTTGFVRWTSLRRTEWAREAALLHTGRPRDRARATRAWWWARWERNHTQHVLIIVAAVLASGTALAVVLRTSDVEPASWTRPLSGLGVLVLGLLAVGLVRLVHLAAKQPESGRRLGVLADIASFWPREAHPIVPPCYALKVVPELVARVREHLRDPGVRVVLTGHSQGSLLAAVAVARLLEELPEQDRARVGLLTAGSQLQWAYPRAFPAVVPHGSLAVLSGGLGGRWRALCRGTDPLGGAVTTWGRQVYDGALLGVGFRADGTEGALPAALPGPTGALVLGGDHWLPDPQRGPFPGRRWASGVNAHTEYTSDPEWDRAVAMAAGLISAEPPRPAVPGLPLLRSPFSRFPAPGPT